MGKIEIKALKIMIVDSNNFIAKTLSSILEAFGVRSIHRCKTLEEAEKRFYSSDVDCIFIDFMMEDRTGLEFIKKIRTTPNEKNGADLPIILDTGVTDITTITMARDAGVTEVISKPFSPDQVFQKLDNAINNRRDFIEVDNFVGPNRRRRTANNPDWEGENDRRQSAVKESDE